MLIIFPQQDTLCTNIIHVQQFCETKCSMKLIRGLECMSIYNPWAEGTM